MNTIAKWLRVEDVCLDLEVAGTPALFDWVGQRIERETGLAHHYIAHCLLRREQAGSTGIGSGVAIPHARIEGLQGIHTLYVRPKHALRFGAADGIPVRHVLVLLVPNPAAQEHLELLADVTRLFSGDDLRQRLHASHDANEIVQLLSS